jgi:hypothetical protein
MNMNDEARSMRKAQEQEPVARVSGKAPFGACESLSGLHFRLQAASCKSKRECSLLLCDPQCSSHRSSFAIDADAIHARLCLEGGARRLRRHEGLDGLQSLPGRGRDWEPCAGHRIPQVSSVAVTLARWVFLFGVFLLGHTDDLCIRPEGLGTTE